MQREQLINYPIITAVTRIPTIMGVTYTYWGLMLLISMAAIIVFHSFSLFVSVGGFLYLVGRLLAKYDLATADIWIIKMAECPAIKNNQYWGCKCFAPG